MARKGKKLDLIQEVTTHKNDFKPWPLQKQKPPSRKKIDESLNRKSTKIPEVVSRARSQLQDDSNIPFNLFWQPKPIVGTDPREPINFPKQCNQTSRKDHFIIKLPGRETIEVTDEEIIRNLLIKTYGSACEKECLKVPENQGEDETVLSETVRYRPELYPPLPPGWLDACKHWDCLQSRVLGDPTRTFWSRRGPEVEAFSKLDYKDIVPVETKCEIRKLIEEDRLRLPYDVTKTGYGGYRQVVAKGVPLGTDN